MGGAFSCSPSTDAIEDSDDRLDVSDAAPAETESACEGHPVTPPTVSATAGDDVPSASVQRIQLGKEMGGRWGQTYMGMNESCEHLLIRQFSLPSAELPAVQEMAQFLAKLSAHNIGLVRFVGLDGSDGEDAGRSSVFTVNEYHSGPTIRKLVSSLGALEEHIARLYLVQLLRAVQCLHMNGVLHGDLNSATAHVDTAGNVAVRDYGCDHSGSPQLAPAFGSLQADIAGIGAIAFEMLSGKPLNTLSTSVVFGNSQSIGNSQSLNLHYPSDVSEAAKDFVLQCFRDDYGPGHICALLAHRSFRPWWSAPASVHYAGAQAVLLAHSEDRDSIGADFSQHTSHPPHQKPRHYVVVETVAQGGQAHECKVRPGDVLVSINGVGTLMMAVRHVFFMLHNCSPLDLVFARYDEEFKGPRRLSAVSPDDCVQLAEAELRGGGTPGREMQPLAEMTDQSLRQVLSKSEEADLFADDLIPGPQCEQLSQHCKLLMSVDANMLSVAELKELEIQNDVLWEAELNELDARVGSYDFETSSLH